MPRIDYTRGVLDGWSGATEERVSFQKRIMVGWRKLYTHYRSGAELETHVQCFNAGEGIMLEYHTDDRLNRIGNLLVPNSNYCAFEDWVIPILDQLVVEQEGPEKTRWSPSSVIRRLGKEINNEESVYYWCYKVSEPSTATTTTHHSGTWPERSG
jgi:hypothetical protein